MESTTPYDGRGPSAPEPVQLTRRLEGARALDPLVRMVRPLADALVADPGRRDALHGRWLGHALHPVLTDLPIGFWTSTTMLDLLGGRQSRKAASRLLGLGVLTAVPTALTGLSEWADTGQREQRVGVVHAGANTVALGLFASSYVARRRNHHVRGVLLALVGNTAASVGGYLGGHLISVRKVSSRNPAFVDPVVAPALEL
jgi:uncharacterized membrane protein